MLDEQKEINPQFALGILMQWKHQGGLSGSSPADATHQSGRPLEGRQVEFWAFQEGAWHWLIGKPQHLPRKVYNFYRVARYEHALFFQDYARQPFGRWFTGKLLSNARAFLAKRVRHLITTGR